MKSTEPFCLRIGPLRLENTEEYPFNNSLRAVDLGRDLTDADYTVLTEVLRAGGDVGEVRVSGRANNGFLLAYTGSAPRAELRCVVLGGAV